MKCPNCGADIKDGSKFCEFCGSSITANMKRDQEYVNKAGCPKCGSSNIKFDREKQREIKEKKGTAVVRSTVGFCRDCGYTWHTAGSSNQPKKNNMVWWVLGWIFFFPAPVMVLVWRSKCKWSTKTKLIFTAVFWVILLLFTAITGITRDSDISTSDNATDIKVETVAEDVSNISDLEIIRMSGHPKYYGSTVQAHEVWDSVADKKIHFADKNYSNNDRDYFLSMGGYNQGEKNEIIRDIYINFDNMDCGPVDLNTALDIADEYLPYDIINQWYEFNDSYTWTTESYKPELFYVVSYHLTEAGCDAYYANEHPYSGTMDVTMRCDKGDEKINYMSIQFNISRKPKEWIKSEWHYDFLENK